MPVKLKAQKNKTWKQDIKTKHTYKYIHGDSIHQTLYMRLKHTIL